jgi:hypothetical protein
MSCSNILFGYNSAGSCKIIGGVSTVYLTNSENVVAVGTTGPSPVTQINSFTMGSTGDFFYAFKQIQETSSLTMTPTSNVQNFSLFYDCVLTLVFTDYTADLRYIVKTLSENNLVAVVELRSGELIYVGQELGLDLNGGEGGSGVAAGDRNGFSLTFRSVESAPPLTLDPTFAASSGWTNLISSTLL